MDKTAVWKLFQQIGNGEYQEKSKWVNKMTEKWESERENEGDVSMVLTRLRVGQRRAQWCAKGSPAPKTVRTTQLT